VRRYFALAGALLLVSTAGACASSESRARGSDDVLRLGVFPNLTHAPAFVGLASGIFDDGLAPTRIDVSVFNSGSDAGTALLSGALDAAYIGPGPTVELFVRSGDVAVVSGAVGGGVAFVVRHGAEIESPEDLREKRIAVPAIANTQDVALRTWLHAHGLRARDEGGDVVVVPVDNDELLHLFRTGQLDGAWEPAPWPSLLVTQGLARILVDEATLWPDGEYATTNLLVSTVYMDAHPNVVNRLVRANAEAIEFMRAEPAAARALALVEMEEAGAPSLPDDVLSRAWSRLSFTWDPLASSLQVIARRAHTLGYLDREPSDILRLYRLGPLNAVLEEMDLAPLSPPIEPAA
jgi:NitT/TauT family transport system substrate-binding protein